MSKVEAALAKIELAHNEVVRICEEQWAGRDGWRTTIPANRKRDSDLIIGDALHSAWVCLTEASGC